MTIPPEIAAVREAGEILLHAGHPAGLRILDWVASGCEEWRPDFFGLWKGKHGRKWWKEVRKAQADELIRQSAATLGINDPNVASTKMARLCKDYCEQVWPHTRGAEHCPHEDEFHALLWESLKLWPRKPGSLKHIHLLAILSSGWSANA